MATRSLTPSEWELSNKAFPIKFNVFNGLNSRQQSTSFNEFAIFSQQRRYYTATQTQVHDYPQIV